MWEYEYSMETSAGAGALWQHWADMAAWPQWNDGIETIDVEGRFETGTAFTMTPPGDEPIRLRLAEIKPGESFTDEMDAVNSFYPDRKIQAFDILNFVQQMKKEEE